MPTGYINDMHKMYSSNWRFTASSHMNNISKNSALSHSITFFIWAWPLIDVAALFEDIIYSEKMWLSENIVREFQIVS